MRERATLRPVRPARDATRLDRAGCGLLRLRARRDDEWQQQEQRA